MKNYDLYVLFIMGYDMKPLLQKIYKEQECDIMFEQVKTLAIEFEQSDFNKNFKFSLYSAVQKFLESKVKLEEIK